MGLFRACLRPDQPSKAQRIVALEGANQELKDEVLSSRVQLERAHHAFLSKLQPLAQRRRRATDDLADAPDAANAPDRVTDCSKVGKGLTAIVQAHESTLTLLADLLDECDGLRAERDQALAQAAAEKLERNGLQGERDSLTLERDEMAKDMCGLSQRLEAQLQRTSAAEAELAEAASRLASTEEQLSSLKASSVAAQEEAQQAMAAAQEQLAAVQGELALVTAQHADAQALLAVTRADLSKARESLHGKEQDLEQAHAELGQAREQVTASSAEAARLDAALAERQQQLMRLQAEHDQTQQELSQTQDRLRASCAQAEALSQQLAAQAEAHSAEVGVLQADLEGKAAQLACTQAQLAEALQAAVVRDALLEEVRGTLEARGRQLAALGASLASSEAGSNALRRELAGTQQELGSTHQELGAVREVLEQVQGRLEQAVSRADELQQELGALASQHAELAQQQARTLAASERQKGLLLQIARLSQKAPKGKASEEAEENDTAYNVMLSEGQLKFNICAAPLSLCGTLLAGVMDSHSLGHLVLDLDTSRHHGAWEAVALRMACLAAALAFNQSLTSIELRGWSWSGAGTGLAGPFLSLAGSAHMRQSALRLVRVDSRLIDAECAALLRDLLLSGQAQLKRAAAECAAPSSGGSGGALELYSGHSKLDAWLEDMAAPAGGNEAGGSLSGSKCEALAHESLECHHCVLVMAGLLVPGGKGERLVSLRLDGNKIGDAGVEVLSLALPHTSALRELFLGGNDIKDIKRLARSLEVNTSLRRLDLGGQRFEGIGDKGAEQLARALRNNTTLQDLDLSSNRIGNSGILALGSCLLAHPASGLTRINLAHNDFERPAARELLALGQRKGRGLRVII